MRDRGHDAQFCEHANECPTGPCPCPPECPCRERMCRYVAIATISDATMPAWLTDDELLAVAKYPERATRPVVLSIAEELRMRRDHARKDSRTSKQAKKLRNALEKFRERLDFAIEAMRELP